MTDQTFPSQGYAPGPFRFGDVVNRSFATWGRNLLPFFLIYVVCTLPGLLITLSAGSPTPGQINPSFGLLTGLASIVNGVLTLFVQGVLIILAYNSMRGHPIGIGAAFSRATSRVLPLLGAGICAGLAIILGFVLLIVPGVMLALRWAVYACDCVLEEQGPLASLSRSAELTRGYRWPIFGLTLLFFIPVLVVTAGISVLGTRAFGTIPSLLLLKAWSALVAPLTTTLSTAIYHELRSVKGGGHEERIANVFD